MAIEKPKKGERLRAQTLVDIIDKIEGRFEQSGASVYIDGDGAHHRKTSPQMRVDPVWVLNKSGEDLVKGNVAGISGPLYTPNEEDDEDPNTVGFMMEPGYEVTKPNKSLHRGRFVVLLEDVPDGDYGRASATGTVCTKIKFTGDETAASYCDIADGKVEYLKPSRTGSARITWVSGTDEGTHYAMVALCCPAPARPILAKLNEDLHGGEGNQAGANIQA